ncbi:hypothetical protein [Amycolatopsis sp. FDAARGOS 1241]|uniref:hypothetical protein n=1 Tax=Amycolatopsis sp. FDAARGOS 1241 TaxID=2778070 RepID=UPI001EF17A6E|nr:hypothetical protein [Amycolatopsis sp. FDAARGOS 1241]
MSYYTDRAEQARADKELKAKLEREAARERFDQQLKLAEMRREHARQDKADAQAEAGDKRDRRKVARGKALAWAKDHVVDLLIYPLMLGSAAIAIPLAARWGALHLGESGGLLPILSEWGMVAFSIAVHVSRVRHPQRPVWALQLGTWVFAAVGFAIAVIRGITDPAGGGWDLGVVMGLVSIAGVAAHQLVSAAPRRSPAERAAHRLARQEAAERKAELATRKVAAARVDAARRAAIADAVAEIDPDGTARLVYRPGHYTLHRRGKLRPASVPGLPVAPLDDEGAGTGVADEAAAYLAGLRFRRLSEIGPDATTPPGKGEEPGGVATLDPNPAGGPDRIADHDNTRPEDPAPGTSTGRATPTRRTSPTRRAARSVIPEPTRRSFDELTAEFDAAVANPPDGFDPANAESIRKTLRCGKKPATQLKKRYLATTDDRTGGRG